MMHRLRISTNSSSCINHYVFNQQKINRNGVFNSLSTHKKRCYINTVSSSEVEKFASLSSSWWDHTKNPLIAMNPVRIKYILNMIRSISNNKDKESLGSTKKQILNDKRILDVGCGGGLLSESLSRLGGTVTAIDPSTEIVDVAREHAKLDSRLNIDFRGGVAIEDLVEEQNQQEQQPFDVICVMDVIEHTQHPEQILLSASKLLRKPSSDGDPGGILFASTLNRTLQSYLLAIVGAEYLTSMLPVGTHDWNQFLSPKEFQNKLPSQMKVLDVCGMVAKPNICNITDLSWKLDKNDTNVNWIGAYNFKE